MIYYRRHFTTESGVLLIQKIKLIAVDIDGTLVRSDKSIGPLSRKMLAEFSSRGVEIALSTGRLYHYTKPVAETLNIPVHFICADGAFILPNGYEKPIIKSIDPQSAREIMNRLNDRLHSVYLLLPNGIWCSDTDRINTQILGWGNYIVTCCFGPDEQINALQIICLIENQEAKKVFTSLKTEFTGLDIEINPSLEPDYSQIVIRPFGVNKGSGLETLANLMKIDVNDTLVFGDWMNDIPMLEKAGLSIVPGCSVNEVKKKADIVSEYTNNEDFVGRELERLLSEKKIIA